jgi:ABC-2 type transport system ATP-binding protein
LKPTSLAQPTGKSGINLTISRLSKQYRRDFWGLRDFTLELGPGILGLLGPNGAGKSTLMRILATITRPSDGEVFWNGQDIFKTPDAIRSVLGYLPQDFGVYPNLSAMEFLEYMAAIKGVSAAHARGRIEELLELVNLRDAARRPLGGYSGGMKQRVGIAQALLNDPQLLIVDEPTVGLDPEERVRFRNLLTDLSGERIIILSTHIVSDVEAAASDIAIIQKGRLLAHCPPNQMLRQLDNQVWEWTAHRSEIPLLKQQYILSATVQRDEGVQVRVVHASQPHPSAQPVSPSLEDVYLSYVQQSISMPAA